MGNTTMTFEGLRTSLLGVCEMSAAAKAIPDLVQMFDYHDTILLGKLQEQAVEAALPAYLATEILIRDINLTKDALLASFLLNLASLGLLDEAYASPYYVGTVRELVDTGLRIRKLQTGKLSVHAENFIKLVLTFSPDLRVILIELGWVLFYVRNFRLLDKKMQEKVIVESKLIYAPIAHRLGLYAIKTEIEDLWLKNSKPELYKDIAEKLESSKAEREKFIADFIAPIKKNLEEAGVVCEVKGRPKSIFSIWNKMQKQAVGFEKVYDKFAIRVIIDAVSLNEEKPLCWQAYSIVTEHYKPFPKRLRDWISAPKNSGYESLHTTVETESGDWVEVQIRTQRMDEIAEKGQAAHWKYKESGGNANRANTLDKLLADMRTALEKPGDESDKDRVAIKEALYEKDIFVFTPNGDLIKLRPESCVLDFAFSIHTKLGANCKGAQVNGKFVTNKYALTNGDTVEVVTASTVQASIEWLNYVTSPRAKMKIKRLLAEMKFTEADMGKELLFYKLKQWKVENRDEAQQKLLKTLGFNYLMELYDAIGKERVDLSKYKAELTGAAKPVVVETKQTAVVERLSDRGSDPLIIERGAFSMAYSFAKCCSPMQGEDIFGFVTVKNGIKVHALRCSNAHDLIERYNYRIVPARWAETVGKYNITTNIQVEAPDIQGLTNLITRAILDTEKVLLKAIDAKTVGKRFEARITLDAVDSKAIEGLIVRLKRTQNFDQIYKL
ncbi:MAG: hypothetical protein RIS47_2062 [Bacteroidota bacterium]